MSNKTLFGGLAGGLASFLLGWLIYGILLQDYMAANYNNSIMRPMEGMVWWALILSNLGSGFLLAIVFSWSNTSGMSSGFMRGAILGLLISATYDLNFYAMSTMFPSTTVMLVDIFIGTIFSGIIGAIVGWVMGMVGEKKAA